jgi:hypothetical protein
MVIYNNVNSRSLLGCNNDTEGVVMAGSDGYKFIFFSFLFYGFIGWLLSLGASTYLVATIPNFATITEGNFLTEIFVVLTNPLSAYGFLAWLTIAIFITDLYIIITSLIP